MIINATPVKKHKGITKTYIRIIQKYHWLKLTIDVPNYILNCRSCQIKKLVRLKINQPMTLIDSPERALKNR